MDHAEILAQLARALARAQTTGAPTGPLATRLCDACAEILGAEAGMITLSSATERMTVRATDPAFAEIEDLQEMLGEGPAQLAFSQGRTVITRLGDHDDPGGQDPDSGSFPVFTSLASAIEGPVTVYAVPMRPTGRVVGVLTLFLRGGSLARSLEEAQFLADAVGAALLGDPDAADISAQPSWPQRARLHQATGVVVAQLGIAPTDALAVLRAHAFGRSSTLESVVTDVLDRTLSFSYDEADADSDVDGIVSEQHPRTEEP